MVVQTLISASIIAAAFDVEQFFVLPNHRESFADTHQSYPFMSRLETNYFRITFFKFVYSYFAAMSKWTDNSLEYVKYGTQRWQFKPEYAYIL